MSRPEWTRISDPRIRILPWRHRRRRAADPDRVQLNLASDRLDVAKAIARTIRQSGGGLPFLKAMGVRLAPDVVQVSMNLTNYEADADVRRLRRGEARSRNGMELACAEAK